MDNLPSELRSGLELFTNTSDVYCASDAEERQTGDEEQECESGSREGVGREYGYLADDQRVGGPWGQEYLDLVR